ncbi:MAG: M18 family aminopeptidase [Turneriella sp.]
MDSLEFLHASPSPAWVAENAAQILCAAGFSDSTEHTIAAGSNILLRPHPGMLIAARLPEKANAATLKFRIIGAHTDSPHLRLKPNAEMQKDGMTLLASEVYGGALLYTWFDRELGIAGEVYYKEGNSVKQKLVKAEKPLSIVPSLAIHLQRGVNEDGFVPAKKDGLNAIFASGATAGCFTDWLCSEAGVAKGTLLSYDLSLFDLAGPSRGGVQNEFVHSARLDNLASCHAAIGALIAGEPKDTIQIAALFDHEEIGSVSESGAESGITENLLREILVACTGSDKDYRTTLGQSVFLSADMAHGVHPHFGDRHDTPEDNRPHLGGGVTAKINQNRRYATSAATLALFKDICRTHELPHQVYTHRNDLPCGSTIGPAVSAKLGIPTLDVGVAMLGMHSIRETCAYADLATYQKFMHIFLNS